MNLTIIKFAGVNRCALKPPFRTQRNSHVPGRHGALGSLDFLFVRREWIYILDMLLISK